MVMMMIPNISLTLLEGVHVTLWFSGIIRQCFSPCPLLLLCIFNPNELPLNVYPPFVVKSFFFFSSTRYFMLTVLVLCYSNVHSFIPSSFCFLLIPRMQEDCCNSPLPGITAFDFCRKVINIHRPLSAVINPMQIHWTIAKKPHQRG